MAPNRGRRRLLATLPMVATALYLRPALADPTVRQAARPLLGTRVDMTVQADRGIDTQVAMTAAFSEMQRLHDMLSRYRIGNPVHALHLAAGVQAVPVTPEMLSVLQMALQRSQQSGGTFDITVGAVTGWDFSQSAGVVPPADEIARELPLVDYRQLVLDEKKSTAYLRRRGMRIDLGGIAKLPILQAGMRVLKDHGIRNAMLNGGGDVLVSGQLQGRDWRIGLRDPRSPERILGTVHLREGFVAASGDYERFFMRDGQRFHHILDPQTGQPTRGPHGVALISRTLEDINGLGAAIMVAGAAAGRAMLKPLQSVDALIVEPKLGLWLSAGMAQRLRS